MKMIWVFLACVMIATQVRANDAPSSQNSSISDEIKKVIEVFEKKRKLNEQKQKKIIKSLKNGKSVASPNEAAALKRYNNFYTNNPALRKFEPSSRDSIERERARAGKLNAAAAKKRKDEIKNITVRSRLQSRQIFIPLYGDKEVSELAGKAPYAHIPRLNVKDKLGLESVGLYVGTFKIVRILSDNISLAQIREKYNSYAEVCIEGDTKEFKIGSEIFLNKQLYYTPRFTKISYQSGKNTFVRDKSFLVLAPFPHKIEELKSAWDALNNGVESQDALKEKKAESKLRSAKLFLKVSPTKARSKLKEILKEFSGTKAATEAKSILEGQ